MFEGSFRQVLRREIDAIPLPPEARWVPATGSRGLPAWIGVAIATVALVLGAVAIRESRQAQGPAAQQPAAVTPPSRPTIVDSRGISPLRNAYRNTRFSYNLLLPAWFHEAPKVALLPSEPNLLDRTIFTARTDADEARFAQLRPWDLIVEVYRREGRSLEDWAGALGCDRSGPVGASTCTMTTTRLGGAPAVVGTRSEPQAGKIYLVDPGEQILVLRYALGDESDRPADVTEATLDGIVSSLGLP